MVVVSDATASRFWPGDDPIGKSITVQKATARFVDNLPQITQAIVVGVAKDVTSGWVTEGRDPVCLYFPTSVLNITDSSLLVRAGKGLREELVRQWPALPIQAVALESVLRLQVYPFRAAAWIGSVLGAIALLLTVSGMYGVMSYLVGQRRREIGIRMALGSTPALVVRLIMSHSIAFTVVGLSVGIAIATALGMLVKAVIPVKGIIAGGALDLQLAAATVTAAALLAAFLPSRRAARVDPALALRTD